MGTGIGAAGHKLDPELCSRIGARVGAVASPISPNWTPKWVL